MTGIRVGLLCVLSVVVSLPSVPGADPKGEIRLAKPTADGPAVVEVAGLPKDTLAAVAKAKPAAAFTVVVADGTAAEVAARPPLAGSYSVAGDMVRFEPAFPLVPGVNYKATFDPGKIPGHPKAEPITAVLSIPKPPPGPPVTVAAVYPSALRLPENTLRFYVQFSGPMSRGREAYQHIRLVRADGTEVRDPFLDLAGELWSADGTRLTVFLHPGRVKKGLQPREEQGPILEEDQGYVLEIDPKWEDADGRPLGKGFRKRFSVGPADDEPVDPDQWTIIPPRGDSPLIIRLAKPLDHALLGRMVWVADAAGKRVDGTITVGGGERVITFAPAKPWTRGDYKLVVDTRLEDVCGNRVGQPFEVDVFKPVTGRIAVETAERPFTVR